MPLPPPKRDPKNNPPAVRVNSSGPGMGPSRLLKSWHGTNSPQHETVGLRNAAFNQLGGVVWTALLVFNSEVVICTCLAELPRRSVLSKLGTQQECVYETTKYKKISAKTPSWAPWCQVLLAWEGASCRGLTAGGQQEQPLASEPCCEVLWAGTHSSLPVVARLAPSLVIKSRYVSTAVWSC